MNNQQILENAPEGATHYDGDYFYICNEDARKSSQIWNALTAYSWDETGNLRLCDLIDMRSLADIARIAELECDLIALHMYELGLSYEDAAGLVKEQGE